jgi:predicted RND superfamily exporter protein
MCISSWQDGTGLFDSAPLAVIEATHLALEKAATLGNVWSQKVCGAGCATTATTASRRLKYVVVARSPRARFIAKEGDAVLVTGRLPDIDASDLPLVEKVDAALDPVRAAHPNYEISVTGLPALAARNSHRMISELNISLPLCVLVAATLLAIAFRSVFVGVISLLPGLFPVVASGAMLYFTDGGLEFSSVVALLVVFGLGVDALIHFLNRLRLEERAGDSPEAAIRRARVLVGPAIILTTIVLAFGLGVTVFSDLPSLRLFGLVCGVTLLASLVADLGSCRPQLMYRRFISRWR